MQWWRPDIRETEADFYAALVAKSVEAAVRSSLRGDDPFGAIVTDGYAVLSIGENTVHTDCDPTAHAEVNAIRLACKKRGNLLLASCVLFASCEPCRMCAALAARVQIGLIVYAASRQDAEQFGFFDNSHANFASKRRAVPFSAGGSRADYLLPFETSKLQ